MISGDMKRSGNGREGGSRQSGKPRRCSGCRQRQRAYDDPSRELDFKTVVSGRPCVRERGLCGVKEADGVGLAAGQILFGRSRAPRLGGDPAERETRIKDHTMFHPQRCGGRCDREGVGRALADFQIARMAGESDAFVAHFADFDSRFVPAAIATSKPWICSCHDLEWPRQQKPGEGLVKLALAHDLGVSVAHRAAADVDLLARLFSRVAEMGVDIQAMLTRGLRPKSLYQALVSYDDRKQASDAGFRWNDDGNKMWTRKMADADVGELPFKTRQIQAA